MKILTVEDEDALQDSIQEYLTAESYECDRATTYVEGNHRIKLFHYDCILLDITLPDGNGLRLLEEIQVMSEIPPVIIISAKNSVDDRIKGLNLGADDYLTKPFHLSELNARIKAVARRKSQDRRPTVSVSNVDFDIENKETFVEGAPIPFTRKEFDILFYLVENSGRVVHKSILVKHIWSDKINSDESGNFLFSHIKNIKRKLVGAGAKLSIRTVYGLGYQLRLPE